LFIVVAVCFHSSFLHFFSSPAWRDHLILRPCIFNCGANWQLLPTLTYNCFSSLLGFTSSFFTLGTHQPRRPPGTAATHFSSSSSIDFWFVNQWGKTNSNYSLSTGNLPDLYSWNIDLMHIWDIPFILNF
jgi:hypothetical protein